VLHNLPAGNWDAGERGIACHPTAWPSSAGVDEAIRYAARWKCRSSMPGRHPAAGRLARSRARGAGRQPEMPPALKEQGIRLLIEPINTSTFPASSSTPRARRWS
jgi:hydroxypyruvate isomerase